MDAFFAAVEQRDNPDLQGKPVIVGAPADKRGVVSTASYEAREFGVHSGMPSRTAHKLCPHGIFVPVRGARYSEVSAQVMDIFNQFTPFVEQVSVDEAFLDVAGVLHHWGSAAEVARQIKARIHTQLQLTVSAGVAPNKFLAKLASDLEKPDGLTVVPDTEPEIIRFLAPLSITRIWGIGKKTATHLHRVGLETIADIQRRSEADLVTLLGAATAGHVLRLAFGRDERAIQTETEEKSVSNETTFETDITSREQMRQTLLELAEKVGRRLRRHGKRARTGRIKLRFSDFTTLTRQRGFTVPSSSDRDFMHLALDLFEKEKLRQPVRLLGFGVSNLVDQDVRVTEQQMLFSQNSTTTLSPRRNRQLDSAVDKVRNKFGRNALKRGTWEATEEKRGARNSERGREM